jgi:hypothetical protein
MRSKTKQKFGATQIDESEVHFDQPKAPCNCNCKADKSIWNAKTPSSPEFILELDEEVKDLLEKAKQIRINGRQR